MTKKLHWWLHALTDDRKFKNFIQVDITLFESEAFQNLTDSAKITYLCLCYQAGHNEDNFTLSRYTAKKKYGISESTLRRNIAELQQAGFINVKSGWTTREKNVYSFSARWKPRPQNASSITELRINSEKWKPRTHEMDGRAQDESARTELSQEKDD